jgi:cytochrome c oxidase cbb3-type subunit 3
VVAPAQDKLAGGKALFSVFCASCHGEDGTGTFALGARNLTNGTWLYGGSAQEIRAVVANGRASDMPAQRDILAPKEISLLTTYVRSLGDAQSDE